MKRRLFLALALWPSLVLAHSSKLGHIAIGHSWALPTAGPEANVMMPLMNLGTVADELLSAKTNFAASTELRGGLFILDPNRPFPMRATAKHIALIGLTKPLLVGDIFPLTLTFKNAGEIEIQIHVSEKPGD